MNARNKYKPGLAIEIAELAILGLDLARVDLWMMSENVLPPSHLVNFLEMNSNLRLILYREKLG
jgi:hypothetical protein